MGHFKYFIFYILCGVAAGFVHLYLNSTSSVPAIGASGAISAILGAYMIKFPRARIKTLLFIFIFVTIINVPAITFIGIWFFIQLLSSIGASMSNVAWYAHIGGFLFGLLTIRLFQKKEGYRKYRVY